MNRVACSYCGYFQEYYTIRPKRCTLCMERIDMIPKDYDREEWMKRWDSWVKYHKSGGGGDWPTQAFESLLDYFEESWKDDTERNSS